VFLCNGNSARSIFAEYFLKQLRPDRFEVYSAGSHPRDKVDPLTLAILADQFAIKPEKARSKSLAATGTRFCHYAV
jgi:arsenate reductase